MREQDQSNHEGYGSYFFTLRDLATVAFRHIRLILFTFLSLLLITVLFILQLPTQYEAQMKILVKRQRLDPLVTVEATPTPSLSPDITMQELNSELELLKSRDLIEKVVLSCQLDEQEHESWALFVKKHLGGTSAQPSDKNMKIARAVFTLRAKLRVELLKDSNFIRVTYKSPDPELSARVLNTLADLYLEKHLAVHRSPGTLDFFQHEAERYRNGLAHIEGRLADFGLDRGVVSMQLEKELLVRKFNEFEVVLQRTRAEIVATKERIRELETELASAPARTTTQISSSSRVLEELHITLSVLERKRTELLGIYKPSYPSVQEVEKQIAQTRESIAASEKTRFLQETTNTEPTYEWLRSELAKSRSELAALQAHAQATNQTVLSYREKARQLGRMEMSQEDLVRNEKMAEQAYLIYSRKQEEARISEALDHQRILNVAIAEAATIPFLPSDPSSWLILLVGGCLAGLISMGLAFASDYLDPSFRTPHELEAYLNIPVAAAMPKSAR